MCVYSETFNCMWQIINVTHDVFIRHLCLWHMHSLEPSSKNVYMYCMSECTSSLSLSLSLSGVCH